MEQFASQRKHQDKHALDEVLVTALILMIQLGAGEVESQLCPEQAQLDAKNLLSSLRHPRSKKVQEIDEICADLCVAQPDVSIFLRDLLELISRSSRLDQ